MTEPTQAQVKAALEEYNNLKYGSDDEEAMLGALTAAAQVGEKSEEDEIEEALKSSIGDIAAAQVGEQARKQFNEALELALVLQTKRDTIERCAQVADAYTKGGEELGTSGIHTKIAAAIRKLKDEI